MKRLAKLWSLSWPEKVLLVEALWLLATASLSLRLVPFRTIHEFLRGRYNAAPVQEGADASAQVRAVKLAVSRAALGAFWKPRCLSQSIACLIMLRRRGVPAVLVAGVKILEDASLAAHAWIVTDDNAVAVPSPSEFTVILKIGEAA